MTRRSPLAPLPTILAMCALVLSGCGEQVPGGMSPGGESSGATGAVSEAGSGGGAGGSGDSDGGGSVGATDEVDDDEDASDSDGDDLADAAPEDPIVVQIGQDEYATNMAIYRRYDAAKGGPLALLAPVAPAEDLAGGMRQEYRTGSIYWHPDTGAHIVRGQILSTYLDEGGPTGQMGWPVGDETVEGEVIFSDFEHGRISLENASIRVTDDEG